MILIKRNIFKFLYLRGRSKMIGDNTYKYKGPRTSKSTKLEEDMESILSLRSCHLCAHQPVCVAFGLFKQSIEPNIMDPNHTLKAENLARICNLYQEKGLE